jgi:hypothetical protein
MPVDVVCMNSNIGSLFLITTNLFAWCQTWVRAQVTRDKLVFEPACLQLYIASAAGTATILTNFERQVTRTLKRREWHRAEVG